MNELLIFDLDNTLLAGDSDRNWGIFLAEQKVVKSSYLDESEKFYNNYYDGSLDIDGFLSFCLKPLIENDMSYLLELRKQFIEDKIKPIITEPGRKIINQAIEDGKTVIIATATNDFVTRPIADLFNVRTLIATEFEVINQKFTGKVLNTPCFREGKVSKVKKWVDDNNFDLSKASFYSDSFNDLPLLEKVRNPVIVDGDDKLLEIGKNRNWDCISFR
ncbi:HAD-IB family hydrolase [Gammaproteobacteria bacterium]|nr:HAD-IB family hydrolase [Gammaproteobacteria bacterium]